MILSDRREKPAWWRNPWVIGISLAILVFAGVALISLLSMEREVDPEIHCGAETIEENGGKKTFVEGGYTFLNGHTQANDLSHEGDFSSRVLKDKPYGLGIELKARPGEIIQASIWKYTKTEHGAFIIDGNWGLYTKVRGVETQTASGWEQLKITVKVPHYAIDPVLKAYAYNNNEEPAWFDDLSIQRLQRASAVGLPEYSPDSLETLNLVINDKGLAKIKAKRDEAIRTGLLKSSSDDFVKIRLETPTGEMPGSTRLKGDWTDHLSGEKWSFRIKVDAPYSWNRLMTFSVQNPNSRSFLDEWVYHKILVHEGLLAPRYDFINLKLNGKSLGIYAYEEHFEKQIPEYNYRREGPIVKFDESGFWDLMEVQQNEMLNLINRMPVAESATIIPFKEGKTISDSNLSNQFEAARDLLFQYQNHSRPVEDIFDLDLMAKFMAIVDINAAHHGFIWHNQRFYYNPVLSRLEPIGFDGFTSNGPLRWINRPFIGYARNIRRIRDSYKEEMFSRFFESPEFMERYVHYLVRYTQEEWITQFLAELEPEILHREAMIKKEYGDYHYDRNFLIDNAKNIRKMLFPFPKTSVKAYYQGIVDGKAQLSVYSYNALPVRLVGVGNNAENLTAKFDKKIYLDAFSGVMPPEFEQFNIAQTAKNIFFEVPGIDSLFSAPIYPWKAPDHVTSHQELFSDIVPVSNELYDVVDDEITFKPGKHIVSDNILFPKGYLIKILPGTELDLVKKAKFVSYSPASFIGTAEKPIKIYSSDKTGNGVHFLQTGEKSSLQYVIFDQMNTLSYKGWNLSGMVTFYEADVDLTNCSFLNSQCEDALNIVRSVFKLNNGLITNALRDAFDSDFSQGEIHGCYFKDVGNDAIDFSGSKVTVFEAKAENIGDKAISTGEQTTLTILKYEIIGANMGAVAKDLSVLDIKEVTMKDVGQAFAAYQKKPEYGPATIKVGKYTGENIRSLHLIEQGSVLFLEGTEIKGDK